MNRFADFLTLPEWLWPSWQRALHHGSTHAIASRATTAHGSAQALNHSPYEPCNIPPASTSQNQNAITYEHHKTWTLLATPTHTPQPPYAPRVDKTTRPSNFNATRTCLLFGLGHACHVQHQRNTEQRKGARTVLDT